MMKTAEVFFTSPSKKHYLMDISRSIGLAHTSVKKNLDELVKMEMIKEYAEKKGGRSFPLYMANTEGRLFKRCKIIHNLSFLMESGVIDFIEEKLMPRCIVLFGSYQKGEDTEDSDIDIFVECPEEKLDLRGFEEKLNRKIELHFNERFASYPKELKNNIINGVVLMGFLEGYE